MKRRRWVFGVVVVAGVVALVVPAVVQGKAQSASLVWSRSRGGAALTSYDFGAVDGAARVVRGFRLGSSALTKSGRLKITLTGSPAFSIASDHCTGKSIGRKLSCWVGVAYRPLAAPSDSATLTARSKYGAGASFSLSGSSPGPYGHLYSFGGDGYALVSFPRDGGGPVTTLAISRSSPNCLAVDGANAYWTAGGRRGTVNKVSVGGGHVTVLATGQVNPGSVAVDGTHVYWSDNALPYGAANGTVNKVSIGGGPVITLATGQTESSSLAVDGTNVYWYESSRIRNFGAVNEVPIGGGTVTTLAKTHWGVQSLAVRGTHVYFSEWLDGTVNEVPVGGGPVTVLATGQRPYEMAVDDSHAYWVSWPGGTVNEVPLGGGPVTTLATGQSYPDAVAVDGTYFYWSLGPGTGVSRVPLAGGPVTAIATGGREFSPLVIGP